MADQDEFIMLKGARVSFPHLFKKPTINGQEGKCGAALMLDPDSKDVAKIQEKIDAVTKERFKGRKLPTDKLCLRDGEDKGRAEYDGYMVLSTNSKDRPTVIGQDGRSVIRDESACAIYAGCYVNAKVRLWAQDNQYGKRINCELIAIQFERDGDPLDGGYVSEEDAMDGFDATADMDDFLEAS